MKRLRIAHLIDLANVGGVETLYAEFLRASPPDGWHVEHLTVADSPEPAARFSDIGQHGRYVSWRCLGPLSVPRRPYALRAWNRLRLIRQFRPDLVVAWNQFTDFRLDPVELGCPLVYYEHGMSWYTHHPRQLQGFFPHVASAIAVSRAGARMLQLKHRVPFDVTVCPNPVRPGLSGQSHVPRGLPSGRPLRLGFAGRLVPLKAVGLLILAIEELRSRGMHAEARIAGEGAERPVLEALVKRLGLEDRVIFLGLVDDMSGFYRSIDLFVMTSMHETMPLVCLEAMAHGLPVLCPTVDGFPEVVDDGKTGACLAPRWPIDDYARATGASTAFAREVYDPDLDSLVPTRLMHPADMADALQFMTSTEERYRELSAGALAKAAVAHRFDDWLARFYARLAAAAGKP
ncbi:glycosyltransferase [Paludibacterium paludis]|uniref:Glycosyltransferase subfamily 4-like N-terminal domain-containing protein n=1 Tax=Paludibacterium paludis TaxID=1225769 RepID=A0A918UAD3_9NEIS|nr:glycosyltransferase [Paludibacterium paludis]GGY16606.1 hypothetical protein GCM10011289_19890 [Paludibacterium paludis]